MLEKLPHAIGEALRGIRPGLEKTVYFGGDVAAAPETITVTSSAFAPNEPIPPRFTQDGAGISPPLAWAHLPAGAAALVLLIEDADSPTPQPLVHLIAWDLPARDGGLAEGEARSSGSGGAKHPLGKNSFMSAEYLPPDPPSGHGPHRYVVQVYALDRALNLSGIPGRGAVLDAMRGHVLAKGHLVGTYERR